MALDWLQSLIYGLAVGLTDIFPVSAQAHETLLLKLYGVGGGMELMELFVHAGILVALYISSRRALTRMARARALARVPKRRRKRPLDERSMMDSSLLRTMSIPVILGLLLHHQAARISDNLLVMTLMLFLNGVLLYIPQFLPGSNRDSRTLSRVEGILMGLGGGLGVIPGVSAVGAATSVGSVCGVDRTYGLNMVLMMNIVMTLGRMIYDVAALAAVGIGALSVSSVLHCLAAALAAFLAAWFAIRFMRRIALEYGNTIFALYCIGLALFIFILNLLA